MSTVSQWVTSPEQPGYRVKTIQKGNCTIQILRPELDARERARREAHVKTVAESVLRDHYIRKEEKA